MSQTAIGPQETELLKARVACCRRAENRIRVAMHQARGAIGAGNNIVAQSDKVLRLKKCIMRRDWRRYSEALMALELCRSKIQAKLDGFLW